MTFVEVLSLLRMRGMELYITNDQYLDATKFELHYKHGLCCRNGLMLNDVLKQPDADERVCYFITKMAKELDEYVSNTETVTWQQVLEDFKKRYPEYFKHFVDYRPTDNPFIIKIWLNVANAVTGSYTITYDYTTKSISA